MPPRILLNQSNGPSAAAELYVRRIAVPMAMAPIMNLRLENENVISPPFLDKVENVQEHSETGMTDIQLVSRKATGSIRFTSFFTNHHLACSTVYIDQSKFAE